MRRAAFLLGPKDFDRRIVRKFREKSLSLSLTKNSKIQLLQVSHSLHVFVFDLKEGDNTVAVLSYYHLKQFH